jgi:hypothetical protein
MVFLLRTISNSNDVNEYCNRIANLLETKEPEISRRLRSIPHEGHASANCVCINYSPTSQTVELDNQPFPDLSQPVSVSLIYFI